MIISVDKVGYKEIVDIPCHSHQLNVTNLRPTRCWYYVDGNYKETPVGNLLIELP